ncbi:MAG: restriction endonuclease subunit S [Eubacteriales bacterium]|nr:restriction endonuclease subunit S [Eubacteriales bacterium]
MARAMKDSGIEWIGEIPEGWGTNTAFQIFTQVKNKNEGLKEQNLLSLSYGKIKRKSIETVGGLLPENFDGYNIIEADDIVLRLTDLQNDQKSLRVGISPERGIVTSAYLTLRNRSTSLPEYLYYYLHAFDISKGFYGMGAGVRQGLNWDGLKWLKILTPPVPEQEKIVSFLDAECARIDAVIEQTRASIEEYKKLKQSVITQAVTKGIRPGRKMKDSGVEWIGVVPEEWAIIRLQHIAAAIESGTSVNAGQAAASVGELGVLKTSCVSRFVFLPEENKSVNKDEENRVSCPVRKNTIIVSRMNTPELVGACGYVSQDYDNLFLPDRLWQVHFKPNTNVKYIYYWLRSACVRNYYSSLAVGTSSSMQNISQDQFYHACCPFPAAEEQKEIVAFLDEKCNSIDFLIDMKSKFLAELESYKKSLIFEYVTGKKEVPK